MRKTKRVRPLIKGWGNPSLTFLALSIVCLGGAFIHQWNLRFLTKFTGSEWPLRCAIFLLFVFALTAFFVLSRRPGALLVAEILLMGVLTQRIYHNLIFGTYGEGPRNQLFIILFCLVYYFSRRERVCEAIELKPTQQKTEKIIYWTTATICVISIFLCSIFIVYKRDKIKTPYIKPVPIVYETQWDYHPLANEKKIVIFDWSFSFSRELSLKRTEEDEEGRIIFSNDKNSFVVLEQKSIAENAPEVSLLAEAFGIKGGYRLERKIYNEQIGIVFLIIRDLFYHGGGKIFEVRAGPLKGFLRVYTKKDNGHTVYRYSLFDRKDQHINISFLFKGNAIKEEQMKDIITSLQYTKKKRNNF